MALENPPVVTVGYLIYNGEEYIDRLFNALLEQNAKKGFIEAIFVNDCSSDRSRELIENKLAQLDHPKWIKLLNNEENMGLSRSINRLIENTNTPYLLTCHCDCVFSHECYVQTMVNLLEKHQEYAALAGQPTIDKDKTLNFAEKLDLIANLMDVFPDSSETPIEPISIIEGRCDIFKISALHQVGCYNSEWRVCGEDHELAARFRSAGFKLGMVRSNKYYLGSSDEQNTVSKLMKHHFMFGQVNPRLILKNSGVWKGLVGETSNTNRQIRTVMRASHMLSVALVTVSLLAVAASLSWVYILSPWIIILGLKYYFFAKQIRLVGAQFIEAISFLPMLLLFDFTFTLGIVMGFLDLARSHFGRPS